MKTISERAIELTTDEERRGTTVHITGSPDDYTRYAGFPAILRALDEWQASVEERLSKIFGRPICGDEAPMMNGLAVLGPRDADGWV